MAAPELTVLMTIRNGEPYVHDAVESILNQTYRDYSFLILDNASTDGSRDVVRGFDDPRIELVELSEDIGQSAALNRGLEMTDSRWVARMDADDISLPNRLELQMDYLQNFPDVVLLGTAVTFIDDRGVFLRNTSRPTDGIDLRWQYLLGIGGLAHSSVVFLAAAAAEAGRYPVQHRHVQDFVLWSRLFELGRVGNLRQRLVRIRQHHSNITEPERAEVELRNVMGGPLTELLPDEGEDTISKVIEALRYEAAEQLSPGVASLLATLPRRFERAHGSTPSRSALSDYAQRWLYMARVSSLRQGANPMAWVKLAMASQPSLVTSTSLWRTYASLALAPLRRRRVSADEAYLPSRVP